VDLRQGLVRKKERDLVSINELGMGSEEREEKRISFPSLGLGYRVEDGGRQWGKLTSQKKKEDCREKENNQGGR